jgi:GNAT superfamily N-acetyltransferase
LSVGYFELTLPDETCRPIIIRETKPEEMLAIEWLRYTELDRPLGLPLAERKEQKIDRLPGTIHIAAFDGDTPVGTLRVEEVDEASGYISWMAVASEMRCFGIGRSCLQFAGMLASDRGLDQLSLHAQPEIPPYFIDSKPFYEKNGYAETGDIVTEANGDYPYMVKALR